MTTSKDFTDSFCIPFNMTSVIIREVEELRLEGKPVIQAFAGSGMVASIASYHLIEDLGLKEKGYIQVKQIPTLTTVKGGVIQQPIRLYESKELGLVLCDISITQDLLGEVVDKLMSWYQSKNPSWVIIIGGLPTNRRVRGGSTQYYCIFNEEVVRQRVESKNLNIMSTGAVYGSIALSLLEATNHSIPCLAILGECIATIPDYSATLTVLKALSKMLELKISTEKLNKSASQLDEKIMSQILEIEEPESKRKSDTDTQYI